MQVRVVRDRSQQQVNSTELVVGDVMVVEAGDVLTADGLLFRGDDIRYLEDKGEGFLKVAIGFTVETARLYRQLYSAQSQQTQLSRPR